MKSFLLYVCKKYNFIDNLGKYVVNTNIYG